eukprot:TRINITY_DN702_c0_g1_i2.p1 TRINITY_DN702_c0_g1~~TRINITY_DN702_c0_g1_i2.p1  ORF type:complete len:501 (+),score=113.83 TRINITY_DN702_c0_g1_i2:89-1591(+)
MFKPFHVSPRHRIQLRPRGPPSRSFRSYGENRQLPQPSLSLSQLSPLAQEFARRNDPQGVFQNHPEIYEVLKKLGPNFHIQDLSDDPLYNEDNPRMRLLEEAIGMITLPIDEDVELLNLSSGSSGSSAASGSSGPSGSPGSPPGSSGSPGSPPGSSGSPGSPPGSPPGSSAPILVPTVLHSLEAFAALILKGKKAPGTTILKSASNWMRKEVKAIGIPYKEVNPNGSPFVHVSDYPSLGQAISRTDLLKDEPRYTSFGRVLNAMEDPSFSTILRQGILNSPQEMETFIGRHRELGTIFSYLPRVDIARLENQTDTMVSILLDRIGFNTEYGFHLCHQQIIGGTLRIKGRLKVWAATPDYTIQGDAIFMDVRQDLITIIEDKPQGLITAKKEIENQACQVIGQASAAAIFNRRLPIPRPLDGQELFLLRFTGTRMKLHSFYFPDKWFLTGDGNDVEMKVLPDDDGWDLLTEDGFRNAIVTLGRLHRRFRKLNRTVDYTVLS